MTTLEQMQELQKKFVKKIQDVTNVTDAFKAHDKYYKWLHKQVYDTSNSKEVSLEALKQRFVIIHQGMQLLERHKIKSKDVTTHWNKRLIARIGKVAIDEKNRLINESTLDEDFEQERKAVYEELVNGETDLATICYCYSILQRVLGVDVKEKIKYVEDNAPKYC